MLLNILKLLFIIFVIRALLRLGRGIVEGLRAPRESAPPSVPLARDPICGTFVVPSNALSAGTGREMRFFCSENCRRTYVMKIAR